MPRNGVGEGTSCYAPFFDKARSVLPFTPVPGESGVAEAAFAGVFSIFIARNLIAAVTLIWRFFMYYLPLVGLGVFFILATRDAGRIKEEREAADAEPGPELEAATDEM